MTRTLLLGAAAAFGVLVLAPHPAAEAACRVSPDNAGGARVRCDDGARGRLAPDGSGGYRGRVGNKQFRLQGDEARGVGRDNARAARGRGASGQGGVRDNTGSSANCMSGGLRVTNC